jgi:ribose 5-phosphate isomerase B
MKIIIGSDHGGFELKETIREYILKRGLEVQDVGVFVPDSVDYPDYAQKVGELIASGEGDLGVLICGTGIGMSISANKIDGIRCALCNDVYSAKMAKGHNDANVIALGARVIGKGVALMIIDTFLTSNFEGGRHNTRLGKIRDLEER